MSYVYSPLRYPGGKSQLYNFIYHTFVVNELTDIRYCEPFCGGAGVAMKLLEQGNIESVILNDADIAIYSIWRAILGDTDQFLSKIQTIPITLQEWETQRSIYESLKNSKVYSFDLGFATFFLNRTNRSGIIEGGPIGGKAQQSKYKIDCRFNRADLCKKITSIYEHKGKITIYHLDALDFINQILKHDSRINFTFFDPPYYQQGQNLYKNGLSKQYHSDLAKVIHSLDNRPWILTYDEISDVKNLYSDIKGWSYELLYSAQIKRKESELLYASSELKVESYGNVHLMPLNNKRQVEPRIILDGEC